MNINSPANSRQLAAMIQGIPAEARDRFIADAKKAKDMEAFIKHFTKTDYSK